MAVAAAPVMQHGVDQATFAALCRQGLVRRGLAHLPAYEHQLAREVELICQLGFQDYFLIVSDMIHWARRQGIPVGPGRGSAAGSLVAYVLEITDVDPLRYRLYFERFLNPERVSPPDIDVDFSRRRRDEVIDYLRARYGADRVAQIATYGRLFARQAVRDAGRILDHPYLETDRLAKLVPPPLYGRHLEWEEIYAAVPELRQLRRDNHPVLILAEQLTGKERLLGVHAAGVVISDEPVSDCLPLANAKGVLVTQWDLKDLEALGFVKFDVLALKNLDVIQDCVDLVRQRHGVEVDWRRLPETEDPAVFDYLAKGRFAGIFQLEATTGMRQLVLQMQPRTIEDLAAAIALYRPGPLGSRMQERYVVVRHRRETPDYLVPELEQILGVTNGQLIYQEQVLEICRNLAGYSLAEADLMRRAIGKKKPEEMEAQRQRFLAGMVSRGYTQEVAAVLFQQIEAYAGYGFNKAHAVAYAFITYQTAWLKTHYRAEFYTALLNNTRGASERDKFFASLVEMREEGLALLPPDLNTSGLDFTLEAEGIRYGLAGIRDVGEEAAQLILELRREAGGRFASLHQFIERASATRLNAKVLEALALAGCFDRLHPERRQAVQLCRQGLEAWRLHRQKVQRSTDKYQRTVARLQQELQGELPARKRACLEQRLEAAARLHQEEREAAAALLRQAQEVAGMEPLTPVERLRLEKEFLGFYLSGHPVERYRLPEAYTVSQALNQVLPRQECLLLGVLHSLKKRFTKKKEVFYSAWLEDQYRAVELLVFPSVAPRVAHLLREQEVVLVRGTLRYGEQEGQEPQVVVRELLSPETAPTPQTPAAVRLLVLPGLRPEAWEALLQLLLPLPGEHPVEVVWPHQRGTTVWQLPCQVDYARLPLDRLTQLGFSLV